MRLLIISFIALLLTGCEGCETIPPPLPQPANGWAVQRMWPVLEAQDKRDTRTLCILMKDPAPEVREAAALAFASVQDTAGIPCLLTALTDVMPAVRSTAAFSLGFVADNALIGKMAAAAKAESDSTVQQAYHSALLLARLREKQLSPEEIMGAMKVGSAQDRARAADAFRRLPDTIITRHQQELEDLVRSAGTEVRQYLLLAMAKAGEHADTTMLRSIASGGTEMERVNALRALGILGDPADVPLFFAALSDPVTAAVAMEQLRKTPAVKANKYLEQAWQNSDEAIRITLLGLAFEHGNKRIKKQVRAALDTIAADDLSPYDLAALIGVEHQFPQDSSVHKLLEIMRSDASAPERQAAFQAALHIVRDQMSRSRYTDKEAQYAQYGLVINEAINTGDPGLISAAAEELLKEERGVLSIVVGTDLEKKVLASIQPLRDLEARLLMDQVIAKRDSLSNQLHQPPPHNHPIDMKALLQMDEGQQYRITTAKGEIVISTSIEDAPGTTLAFDSLVTAGYYDGKAFHRVVPNFVAQGGCERGDGYGGMPWTLRTEIGRTPFTTGSVGMASAGRDTEGAQFFITHSATPHLDGRYTRFGAVVSGMDVVWKLRVGDVIERVERMDPLP